MTSIETGKIVCRSDTLELTPERQSNVVYCVRKLRNYPGGPNRFMFGAENEQV